MRRAERRRIFARCERVTERVGDRIDADFIAQGLTVSGGDIDGPLPGFGPYQDHFARLATVNNEGMRVVKNMNRGRGTVTDVANDVSLAGVEGDENDFATGGIVGGAG